MEDHETSQALRDRGSTGSSGVRWFRRAIGVRRHSRPISQTEQSTTWSRPFRKVFFSRPAKRIMSLPSSGYTRCLASGSTRKSSLRCVSSTTVGAVRNERSDHKAGKVGELGKYHPTFVRWPGWQGVTLKALGLGPLTNPNDQQRLPNRLCPSNHPSLLFCIP